MAIITNVPGISVHILVNNVPLREYTDDDDDVPYPDQITKYVECVSGTSFAIKWSLGDYVPLQGDCIVADIHLDGKWVDGTVYRLREMRRLYPAIFTGARWEDKGVWKEKPFQFADIIINEEGPVSKPSPELRHLGTITVNFYHAQYLSTKVHLTSKTQATLEAKTVHEKHLKGEAISNQVMLGESRPIARVAPSLNIRYLDQGQPFAKYTFQYRSRKNLQALCLIPRTPSPVPLEDRPEESLNREELLELLRRQKRRHEDQIETKPEIKRESGVENDDDDVDVVSFRPPVKKFKSSVDTKTGVETIDLTDD